jgi:hypothetical protein
MKSFMSAAMQDTAAPKGATESNTSNNGVVTTGQEPSTNTTTSTPTSKQEAPKAAENVAVVMQGPLGTIITEALNKSLSKRSMAAVVQTPATETYSEHVQANGQIANTSHTSVKISKAVGMVPITDEAPTVINTLLDCCSKVDDVEFIMVNMIESDPSPPRVPQKSILHCINPNGSLANESYAVESVQVIVNYKKLKG